jgi:hypothetical protein
MQIKKLVTNAQLVFLDLELLYPISEPRFWESILSACLLNGYTICEFHFTFLQNAPALQATSRLSKLFFHKPLQRFSELQICAMTL